MPYFLKINQNFFAFPVDFSSSRFRSISATNSDDFQKVADLRRNHWPICSRIGGRFTSDSLADLHRIMHLEIAFEIGRSSKAWAQQDPDLESLRDNPRFRELVSE